MSEDRKMKWNNAKERKEFIKKQNKLHKEYLAAGMTEEQIKNIYEYDLGVYRNKRIEAIHTQKFDFDSAEFDDKETDNPLFQKFLEKISVLPEYSDTSRFGWIEEVENDKLAKALKTLPIDELELLTEWLVYGQSVTKIAEKQGRNKSNVSRQITRLKIFLKKFL